tara:strand:+ start:6038 stop:6508 length:471 start_codon:yes stop_codon:yes gene_type:complete
MKNQLATHMLSLTGRPDRATDRMRKAIDLAITSADEFGDVTVDSRHVLYGLIREAEGVGFHVLNHLNLTRLQLDSVLSIADPSSGNSAINVDDDIAIVMRAAADAATLMNHNYIGTEHLLLGVVAPNTQSVKLLADLGISDESVTHEVRGLMGYLP